MLKSKVCVHHNTTEVTGCNKNKLLNTNMQVFSPYIHWCLTLEFKSNKLQDFARWIQLFYDLIFADLM